MDILEAFGNTSLIRIGKDAPQVLAKLEWVNPTGSVKDRKALGANLNTDLYRNR